MKNNKLLKILVIDDSDVLRESLKKFLESYFCEVSLAENGIVGLRKAVSDIPDLIFLDLKMPNFGGLDTLKTLKVLDETKNIPVVVITANEDEETIQSSINFGALKVLSKPLTRKIITECIDAIFGKNNFSDAINKKEIISNSPKIKNKNDIYTAINDKLSVNFISYIENKRQEILTLFQDKKFQVLGSELSELKTIAALLKNDRLITDIELSQNIINSKSKSVILEELGNMVTKIVNQLK